MALANDALTPWPEEFVDRYWSVGQWRGATLDNLLRGWALDHGPRTALIDADTGERVTYARLNRRADRMAAGFRLRGMRPGMRVVVQLPNVPEHLVALFALLRAGLVPVICPPDRRTAEVTRLVRATQAVGYLGPGLLDGFDHTAMAAEIAAQEVFLRRVFTWEPPGAVSPYIGGLTTDPVGCQYGPLGSVDAPPEPPLSPRADRVALLLPARERPEPVDAGPWLVPRGHDDYACQVRGAAERAGLVEGDVYLGALPLSVDLVLGGPGPLGVLAAGGAVVLTGETGPEALAATALRERVTVLAVPEERAAALLGAPTWATAPDAGPRLVQLLADAPAAAAPAAGAGPLPGVGARAQRVFGTAEGVLLASVPADPGPGEHEPAGPLRPLSIDDEFRVVDADGAPVPDGEPGELLARGPHTARGYHRAPERDARTFTADGRLRTGLRARRTPDGDLLLSAAPRM
ncbi:AMP-binding protein (plasmid) [Streptomyces sp. BI20]|uniref:AMP-binding protein n=1 Tax=Streptomyces sp. BI20 TaxID=3403460 RepID=UPI003C7676C1